MRIRFMKPVGIAFSAMFFGLCAFGVSAADTQSDLKINFTLLHSGTTFKKFIVTYSDAFNASSQASAVVATANRALGQSSLMAKAQATALSAKLVRKLATGDHVVAVSRALSESDARRFMSALASDPNIVHIEPVVLMHPIRDERVMDATPVAADDKYFPYQWHFRAGDGTAEKVATDKSAYANVGGANVVNAWTLSKGDGVVVAVLDTGITHHPDLDTSLADDSYDMISDKLISGRSADGRAKGAWDLGDWTTGDAYLQQNGGCVDNTNVSPEDSTWHGTHVSGTIGEITDNGIGMAGIANHAKVLPVRVLGHCGGESDDIADAIVWASGGHIDGIDDNKHPAQVINMSLGGSGRCSSTDVTGRAIAAALQRGTTVVVAAGNESADAAQTSPASCPGVITVASNGITGKPAFYSNFGATVTLSAPGGGIYADDDSSGNPVNAGFVWSAINNGKTSPADSGYGTMAGTSQATPHVSGTVALMISAVKAAGRPKLAPGDIKNILRSTARAFPSKPALAYGSGILNAYAAVNSALLNGAPNPVITPLITGTPVLVPAGQLYDDLTYKVNVPKGARAVTFRTYGGSGDVSMFVSQGTPPGPNGANATYASQRPGNAESLTIAQPTTGDWYVRITQLTPQTTFYVYAMPILK